jgi:maleylacetoacetate isomerase
VQLYSFFRSSAAYRVRIALHLKGLPYETLPVHLRRNGGEHRQPGYRALNPEALVPVLRHEGRLLTQSLAIIEYLEEVHPTPALLPGSAADRAWVRALAQHIACEVHPLNNLRVLRYLEGELGLDEERKAAWIRHWVADGFAATEQRLARDGLSGSCCFGNAPTLADCALVPQVANAVRFKVDLAPYPRLRRVAEHLNSLEAFRLAAPERQVDAE